MKRFLEGAMVWKTACCFCFTGTTLLYLVISLLYGMKSVSIAVLLSLLLCSVVVTLLQFLFFTDYFIRKLRYTLRLLLFIATFLPVLAALARLFQWFPADNTISWLTFIGIVVSIFAIMTFGFEIYYQVTGKKYDGLLGQYRKERNERGKER